MKRFCVFERDPPLYYRMRLSRVAAELKTSPALLPDYDDAGVACGRKQTPGRRSGVAT